MKDKPTDLCEIIVAWLRQHGYDGFYSPDGDCVCGIEDLLEPLNECLCGYCHPGYRVVCDSGEHGYDITPDKPEEKS